MKTYFKYLFSIAFPIVLFCVIIFSSLYFDVIDWSNPIQSLKKYEYTVNEDNTITITHFNTNFYGSFVIPIEYDDKIVSNIDINQSCYLDNELYNDTPISVEKNHPYLYSEDYAVYNKDKTVLILAPVKEWDGFTVPASVKTIADNAFNNRKFKNIILNEGIETIGNNAFYDCQHLESITLPNSVVKIGNEAFYGCISIKTFKLNDNTTYGKNTFGESAIETFDASNYNSPNLMTVIESAFSIQNLIVNNNFVYNDFRFPDEKNGDYSFPFNHIDNIKVNGTKESSKILAGYENSDDVYLEFENDTDATLFDDYFNFKCNVYFLQ